MITMGLPQDQAVLAAIGKIAIRHGQLDYMLKMAIRSFSGVTIREAIDATDRHGSRELRKRTRKLALKRFGEGDVLVRLDALLERARRASEKRNELLHGLWAAELDGGPVHRTEGIEFQPIPSAGQLEAVADDLHKIATELNTARLDGFLKQALANPN